MVPVNLEFSYVLLDRAVRARKARNRGSHLKTCKSKPEDPPLEDGDTERWASMVSNDRSVTPNEPLLDLPSLQISRSVK